MTERTDADIETELELDGLTEQDIADLNELGETEEPELHTLLEIWSRILENIETESVKRVPPGMANKVVGTWTKLSFQDVPVYFAAYYELVKEMRDILTEEIERNPDCFKNTGEDEDSDGVANRPIYIELLFRWQALVMRWEHDWDASSPSSHIWIAAIADATNFFVGNQGLVSHLDQIQLQFDETDREAMGVRLQAVRDGLDA